MQTKKLNILIGGPAGAGIEKAGKVLTLFFVRSGYHVFANVEHMSQIRGGNNYLKIRVDEDYTECHEENIDIMVALDRQSIEEHLKEMDPGGAIIYDNEFIKLSEDFLKENKKFIEEKKIIFVELPIRKLAAEKLGNALMSNVIALGVIVGLIKGDLEILQGTIEKVFGGKSAEILKLNNEASEIGEKIAKEKYEKDFEFEIAKKAPLKKMFLMGNDALCIGAMKAGLKFVGEYPMTPSSSVLHFMAGWSEKYGIVVKHVEDEIAAANSIIGAGFAGVRAMAATAGGGFALMTEAVGLASMNEVPVVIVNVMRPGPATGQPTRTEQGDLRQVIHAGQGDPVKIVLLPGDPQECFEMGFSAFNLADKYQLPVIICFDKYLGEGYYTVAPFDMEGLKIERGKILNEKDLAKEKNYKRYLFTEDGVSPRTIPGTKGGIHRATSDEHNEYGEIFEGAENRKKMVEKRLKKLETALPELPKPELIGNRQAEITFVTWASGKGICKDAVRVLAEKGITANVLQIKTAWPFHKKETAEILRNCTRPIMVEQNYTSQLGGLIAENTGILIEEKILRYDGRPMTAQYILDNLNLKK